MRKVTEAFTVHYWFLAVVFVGITSCSPVTVRDRDEFAYKLGDSYSEAPQIRVTQDLYWVQSFLSRQLSNDREELLTHNYEVGVALSKVRQAAYAYGVTKADLLPSVDINADYIHERTESSSKSVASKTKNTLSFGAALNWEPDIWGRLRAREAAASLKLEEQEVLSRQVCLNLQTLLVETWVSYQAARNMEQVIEQQKETNLQMLSLTELRLAQGDGNSLDILQQQGRLLGVERILPGVVAEMKSAANSYSVLLGRLPGESDIDVDSWPDLEPLAAITSPRRLLDTRPDLRAAFLALQAADQEVAAAAADRLPRISIELVYSENGSRLSRIGDYSLLDFTTGLVAPLFDAGRLEAEEKKQRAIAEERLATFEQALLTAVKEVENGLVQEEALFKEYRLLTKERHVAQETVDTARLQYVNGLQTFLPVLAALAKLQSLQQEEIRLKQDILVNRAYLLKALGAKWSDNLET